MMYKQFKFNNTYLDIGIEFDDEEAPLEVSHLNIVTPYYEYTFYDLRTKELADAFFNGTYNEGCTTTEFSVTREYLIVDISPIGDRNSTLSLSLHLPVDVARKIHEKLLEAYELCKLDQN